MLIDWECDLCKTSIPESVPKITIEITKLLPVEDSYRKVMGVRTYLEVCQGCYWRDLSKPLDLRDKVNI